MPYQKLARRSERLRNARLALDLARVVNDSIYGNQPFGHHMDGVFILMCVVIGHAENRLMNVSKIAHYLGMTRQTVTRRLEELIALQVIERGGQYYYIDQRFTERGDFFLSRANNLIEATCRELERSKAMAVPKLGTKNN